MSGMDGNGHRRRRAQQASHRQGLPNTSQYSNSTAPGVEHIRDPYALPTQSSVRRSQFLSQTAGSTAPIHPPVSAQDFGSSGYAQIDEFAPPQVHGPSSTYQSSYSQLSQRGQQIPQYSSQGALNAHQQPQAQGHSPLALDNSSAYTQRQSAAIEVLSNQFGGQTYYDTGQGQAQTGLTSHQSVAVPQTLQYTQTGEFSQQSISSSYVSGDANFIGTSGYDQVWPQEPQLQPESTQDPQAVCDMLLRQTNSLTLNDRLLEARSSLLKLTKWIVDNIEVLGLHEDKVIEDNREWRVAHKQRLKFWSDIHNAWLVFLQRQFDNTRHSSKGSKSSRPKTLSKDDLSDLREEVLRLSDQFDKYGLLNYEQGFQPNELMPYLKKCYKELGNGEGKSNLRRK